MGNKESKLIEKYYDYNKNNDGYIQVKIMKIIQLYGLNSDLISYIPNDIIKIISLFYDVNILFNVHSNTELNIYNECKRMIINRDSYFFINNNNELYIKGLNNCGQLGINKYYDNNYVNNILKHPLINDNNIELFGISKYGSHMFVYTNNNILYGFGYNAFAQIGCKTEINKVSKPIIIEYNFNGKLKMIKCGCKHTLFLNENGNVYGSGNNKQGQLTFNYNENIYNYIQNIIKSDNVTDIYCGINSSYILNNNNNLFSFGSNNYAELGINNKNILKSDKINPILNHSKTIQVCIALIYHVFLIDCIVILYIV